MDDPCLSFYNLHYSIWKAKVPPKIQVLDCIYEHF